MTEAATWSAGQMNDRPRILILGGTTEAVALANRAAADFDIAYSLAGRTRNPALPDNVAVRTGGFGGADALAGWIGENGAGAVIDATHPFAARIARNAAEACSAAGVRRLKLVRPAWTQRPGDDWRVVADVAEAAKLTAATGKRAFLSVGRQDVDAFAGAAPAGLVVRSIDPPDSTGDLQGATFIAGRGPFTVADEIELFRAHEIAVLVSKNAGGDATYAKIAAARELGIKVIMVDRPPVPPGDIADDVEAAIAWLNTPKRFLF